MTTNDAQDQLPIRQVDYAKYISSAAWRHNPARLREFEAAGFACRLCPNSIADGHTLEAHHRSYDRLGNEIDGDLTALCRPCHHFVTSMIRARRYAALPPIGPPDCAPYPSSEPLFDPE